MLIGLFSHVRFSFSLWRKTHAFEQEHRFLYPMLVLSILDATIFPSQALCPCTIQVSNTPSNAQFPKTGLGIEVFLLLILLHPKRPPSLLSSLATQKSLSKVNRREQISNQKWKDIIFRFYLRFEGTRRADSSLFPSYYCL